MCGGGVSRPGFPILLSVVLFLAAQAGRAGAQNAGGGTGTAPQNVPGQQVNAAACYLGGYGQVPEQGGYNSGYPAPAGAYPGMAGGSADSAQQGYAAGQGYQSQMDYYAAQSGASQDQSFLADQSQQDYGSVYGQGQQGYDPNYSDQGTQGYGSSYDQSQGGYQYATGQPQSGYMPNASPMLANQIIQILLQSPDLLSSMKDLAGQQYGVDPTAIPDSGVYNCVQQDPGFRNQVAAQLVQQGYTLNPTQGQQGMYQGGVQANRGRYAQYPPYASSSPYSAYSPTPYSPYSPTPYSPYSPSPYSTAPYAGSPGYPTGPQRQPDQPSELRRQTPIPYPNIPSLRDLYSQEIPAGTRLRRFGSDAFEFGSPDMNLLPMDLPVGPDYVLGSGDNLIVNMWGGQSARLNRTVDRQGAIALPEVGTVAVSGMTIAEAQSAIQKALGAQFQDEHVELSLGRVRTIRVYVVGDVQRPGAYDVSSLSTAVNALYAAGGPTNRGSLRTLQQYRGKQLVQEIDLYDFLLHGVRSDTHRLMAGDTILVPPVGPQVTVAGMVRRPAVYELKGNEDLAGVLSLAGGVLVSADLKEIRVDRVVAHQSRTMLHVQVPKGAAGVETLPAFPVQDGDYIQVSPILPYNNKVVYLDGHVFKPGPYAWREGMTVADLIHSYQDVMPEPADHAEVVRLVPPDLHPETITFNLPDELIGNNSVSLQPFDTVRIFGRYQVDPPRVFIYGPVLHPGSYPMSDGMTVADLARMAGGFRRSAYTQEADLSSYQIQNGEKVLIGRSSVAIQKALDGDKSADVVLKPGDVVGVRQLTGWTDIGSSITINGEVMHDGTYGIKDGERLSSVLKRAGGFRADAYPEGAILDRVQVRQLEEINRQEMIRRIETTMPNVSEGVSGTSQDELNLMQAMQQQRQEVLSALRSHPSVGRMVIKISPNISSWQNTSADIVVRAGDRLTIPKRPDFVLVSGQVYNATGITFRAGKDAGWYLRQAGGPTRTADKKSIFILRADGSVVGDKGGTIFEGGILSVTMHAGDSVIVPEKAVGGSQAWRNIIATAQIASSVALTGAVAGVF